VSGKLSRIWRGWLRCRRMRWGGPLGCVVVCRQKKKELMALCRKREKREAARAQQAAKRTMERLCLTSHLLPGDAVLTIKAGPPPKWWRFGQVSQSVARPMSVSAMGPNRGFSMVPNRSLGCSWCATFSRGRTSSAGAS
jgi:hypothetical protein